MPFRADRRPRGPDPFLQHKTLIFAFGAGCALAGMLFDADWLVTAGIVVLAAGVVLRLVGERRRAREEAEQEPLYDDAGQDSANDAVPDEAPNDGADPTGADAGEDRGHPPSR
jgi:hypothetical protein